MNIDELIEEIKNNVDTVKGQKMSAYMKNTFAFAGIPQPELKELQKPFLKEYSKKPLDFTIVKRLWDVDYREAQYVAIAYLDGHKKELKSTDLDNIKSLITTKSWWETVDSLDAFVGIIVKNDASLKNTMSEWSVSDNIWLKRVAIDFQQKFKEDTDEELLKAVIVNNLGSKEFFINKAIGWSLREYSKTNPDWVKDFLNVYKGQLANLSVKEASKYL